MFSKYVELVLKPAASFKRKQISMKRLKKVDSREKKSKKLKRNVTRKQSQNLRAKYIKKSITNKDLFNGAEGFETQRWLRQMRI